MYQDSKRLEEEWITSPAWKFNFFLIEWDLFIEAVS